MDKSMNQKMYRRLGFMGVLSFVSMYIFMYSMVNIFANVFNSYNQFYMAMVMTAPMMVIDVLVMGSMYPNKKRNNLILGLSVVFLIVFFIFIRKQTFIGDKQFLRSMIPHHAGAILMCENASLEDPQVKQLCKDIISGQQAEINLMKSKLNELD